MRSATTLFAGLIAASAVVASPAKRLTPSTSQDKLVVYWGNTGWKNPDNPDDAGNLPIDQVCSNDAVDKVILSFLTTFPDQNNGKPVLNFANSCGKTFATKNPGTGSDLLWCPEIEQGLQLCKQNQKEVLLSLGGAWPQNQAFNSEQSAKDFASWLWTHFGSNYPAGTERPFGDFVIDGIDLDIEARLDPAVGQVHFPTFINELRTRSGFTWKIGGAPQCVTPDANLGTYIQTSWFDYIFVQLYNTNDCSAKNLLTNPTASSNTFATQWLSGFFQPNGQAGYTGNPNVKVYAGLPAAKLASNGLDSGAGYFLEPDQVRQLLAWLKTTPYFGRFGGISMWDATFDLKNVYCGKPYSHWVKKAIHQALSGDTTPILPNGVCPVVSSSSSVVSSTSSRVSSSTSSVVSTTSSTIPSSSSAAVSSSSSVAPSSSSWAHSSSASSAAPSSSKASSSSAAASPSSSKASSAPAVSSTSSYSHGGNAVVTSSTSSTFSTHAPYSNTTSTWSRAHDGGFGPRPTSSRIGGGGHNGGGNGDGGDDGNDGGYGSSSSSVYGGGHNGGGYGTSPTKSYGGGYVASTSSKAYGNGHGHPTATKTATTTYTDVCETGLTTVTATYTRTCYEGEDDDDWSYTGIPDGWTVTVTNYVPHNGAKPTPITVTKPYDTPAPVPAKPTGGAPGGNYGGKPAVSTMVVVVTPIPAAEYPAYVAKQSAAAAAAAAASQGSYAKPNYGSGAGADYSAVAKPVAPTKAVSAGSYAPTKAGYAAPQFTGAASRLNVGLSLFAGAAVAAVAAF